MTTPVKREDVEGLIARLEELRLFLNGQGDLAGFSYGERPAAKPMFWWRSYLTCLSDAGALLEELRQAREGRDEARKIAGLGCDANGHGAHTPMKDGTYTFCAECGETLTAAKLSERLTAANARALKAEEQREALMEALRAQEDLQQRGMLNMTDAEVVRVVTLRRAALSLCEDDQPLLKTEGEADRD